MNVKLVFLKGNKILLQLLSILILISTLASCAKPKPTPAVYAEWLVTHQTLKERNKTPTYTIDAQYPEIHSYPNTASAQALNKLIHEYVSTSIQNFKDHDHAPRNTPELDDYPNGMHINAFHLTYNYHQLKTRGHTLISVRLESTLQYLGESTRQHRFVSFNYDMNHNTLLNLDALFKPDADYLNVLATKCQKRLSERLTGGMYWMPYDPSYTSAYPQNFKIWNLGKNGLAITFQEYQITPYTDKATVIVLSYSSLRSILADNSPLRGYAYNIY